MNQIKNNYPAFEDINDDSLDIGRIIRLMLMQSKLIAFITISAFLISCLTYFTSTKQYKVTSLLQVESFNQNILDPTDTLQMMSPVNNSIDIENMITLYKSRTNILNLIKDLNLNVISDADMSQAIDISVEAEYLEDDYYEIFYIEFDGKNYSIFDDKKNFIQNFNLNDQMFLYDNLRIKVKNLSIDKNKKLKITYVNPEDLFEYYKLSLNLTSLSQTNNFFSNDSGLIQVSITIDDVELGRKIINKSNEIFLKQRVEVETEKSRAAITFLDSNIETLTKISDINKSQLKDFLEKNKLIDLELETQAVIDNIKAIDKSLNEVDLELSNASEIYTSKNPIYINLISKKIVLENQKELILSQIKEMPREQQEYIDLYTEVETSKILLEELETRRLGFSILEASTIGDIRVVDEAYKETQVSPRLLTVAVITMLSFIFACIISIYRGLNLLPITNPAELFDNNINEPIMGVIPFSGSITYDYNDDKKVISAIESLIVNISHLNNDNNDISKKVILITSPTPANGKSTISSQLANSFANINKKVLLIDCDLKRGNLAQSFNLKSIKKDDFNAINDTNIEDLKVKDDLYIIPRIRGLSNSFQFILSNEFIQKVEYFKSKFDYIIFDTAPILSVADTAIISNLSDINLMLVRHEVTKLNEVKQARENFIQINKSIDGYIYNAYSRPTGYFGYYEYYGNYAYQYYSDKYLYEAYDYKENS